MSCEVVADVKSRFKAGPTSRHEHLRAATARRARTATKEASLPTDGEDVYGMIYMYILVLNTFAGWN